MHLKIAFVIAGFLIWFATEYGEIQRLIRPRDMNANSCGMKTAEVDLTEYPQLYMPNPADEAQQICAKGCPGSSKGSCEGGLLDGANGLTGAALKYQDAVTTDQSKSWARTQSAAALVGVADVVVDGSVPWYTVEGKCVLSGDCSDGTNKGLLLDVAANECSLFGACTNTTTGLPVDPPPGQTYWQTNQQLTCEGTTLFPTGCALTAYEWSPYTWKFDETDQDLYICMPKEGCTDVACQHPDYPPADFMTASRNRWVSQNGPCWMPVLPSEEYLYRCVPTMLADMAGAGQNSDGKAEGQVSVQYMKDLQDYWQIIPFGAFVALVSAFAWIIFLGKVAYYLIIGTCIGVELALPLIRCCIQNHEFCIQNHEFFIQNHEFCIQNDQRRSLLQDGSDPDARVRCVSNM